MSISDDGLRSRQQQLAGDLRALILSGDIAAGERLPSTAELRERYGVNNMTVTRAVAILKAEGLVEGHRGKSVVATGRLPATIRAMHAPPMRSRGRRASTELIEVGEGPAPARVAEVFGLAVGDPVLVRSQLASLDGEPAELVWNYYPTSIARDTELTAPRLLAGGSPAVLAALGHRVVRAVDHVSVRPATVAEFVTLGLPGDVPVLRQFRVAYAEDGRAVEATVMIKSGQRFEIRYDVPLTDQNDSRDS
ncbi:GntR family transcriptional regulator [Paractinoplanes globisporus]|uniref:GntR family transcriptional regulator n=1 Tax=Paractinoplanes globisporus TaxID=113565 RepID=A0ABW6WPH0_9ACTN|nr:GntR family transcriptional regulator [Actinoplanes globisporus]